MKKSLFIILGVLFFSSLVIAVENAQDNSTTADLSTDTVFLTKEVALPADLQVPLKVILGITEETVLWKEFILALGIWIVILLVISGIINLTPFHHSDAMDYLLALVVTLIISLTGSIALIAKYWASIPQFIFNLVGLGDWVKNHEVLSIIFAVILCILFLGIAKVIFQKIKDASRIEKAKYHGEEVKKMNKIAEVQSKAIDNLARGEEEGDTSTWD